MSSFCVEATVRFVDVGGIVDHHCLIFPLNLLGEDSQDLVNLCHLSVRTNSQMTNVINNTFPYPIFFFVVVW